MWLCFLGSQSMPLPQPWVLCRPWAMTCTTPVITPHTYRENLCETKIEIALLSGYCRGVALFSGLAAKLFIDVGAGVIVEDYRGNIGDVLFNFGKEKFEIEKGYRLVQLIYEWIFI